MKIFSPKIKHIIRNSIFAFLGVGAVVFGSALIWISTMQLPDFSSFSSRIQVNSTKVYDRTGTIVLYDLGSDVRRTSIPFAEMGAGLKNAVIAIEDSNFYDHYGVRPKSMLRALIADITGIGPHQGGSTITQQVIKKSLLTDDKTIVRKLKEIILALKLEREYGKEDILAIYLNEIPYGGNIYGIQEASVEFFGKNPADLTLAEAAYLAAIPNAPTYYSPYGAHKDDLDARKNLVLKRERDLKIISEEEYTQAKAEKVTFLTQHPQGIKAPHFVFYIREYLEQKYGPDAVEQGGMKVITTLDYDLQQAAESAITEYTTGDKKQIDGSNAGLVAIDPKTGQILTMVGSRNYFDKKIDGNYNVTTAKRQPGSSFKPFMYATAFKMGYTPETALFDVPTEFSSYCNAYGKPLEGHTEDECYMPKNYDGRYHGPMTVREALARSLNVPAVKMLYLVGVKNAIKTAQDMGITTLTDPDRYGLTLVLGGGEVRLLDMTSAYSVFANEGTRHPYSGILSVTDRKGVTLETWQDAPVAVLPQNVTLQITDILSDNEARTPTFGPNSALHIPGRQVAVKTGTTNNYKDSWTIGYTPSITAGVWLGKNDNTEMNSTVTAAPLWNAFMREALKKYPNETFDKPAQAANYDSLPPVLRGYWQGGESFVIDTVSRQLATEHTPPEDRKEFVITDVHTILHWVKQDDPTSGRPTNPQNASLYNNFETGVRNWWAAHSSEYQIVTNAQRPTGYDTVHTPENSPKITITSPASNATLPETEPVTVTIQYTGTYPLQKTDVYLNNVFAGTTSGINPRITFTPSDISGVHLGENTLSVVATDMVYNRGTANIPIQLSLEGFIP